MTTATVRNRGRAIFAAGREGWLSISLLFAGLFLWEIAVRAKWLPALFFPAPSHILLTLTRMAGTGQFWQGMGLSLLRLFAGTAAGGGIGLLLGWSMGVNRLCHLTLTPFVSALHPLPKLALFPIFLIVFGIGETSKVTLIALTAFFPLLINTLAGVQQIDRLYLEVAANYGATGRQIAMRVILPGSLPMVFAGLKLALNTAFIVTISVEMLAAQQGLGAQIWLAWQTLRLEELYALLLVIAIFGGGCNRILELCTARCIPWRQSNSLETALK